MKALDLVKKEYKNVVEEAIDSLGPVPKERLFQLDYAVKMKERFEQFESEISSEIKRLQSAKRQYGLAKDSLVDYLKNDMIDEGLIDEESYSFKFKVSNSQGSLEIIDESLIPDELFIIEKKPNTKLIKAMLEAGQIVEGCRLVDGKRLTIKAKE